MSPGFNAQQAMGVINASYANKSIREFLINGTTHIAIKNGGDIVVVDASKTTKSSFKTVRTTNTGNRKLAIPGKTP